MIPFHYDGGICCHLQFEPPLQAGAYDDDVARTIGTAGRKRGMFTGLYPVHNLDVRHCAKRRDHHIGSRRMQTDTGPDRNEKFDTPGHNLVAFRLQFALSCLRFIWFRCRHDRPSKFWLLWQWQVLLPDGHSQKFSRALTSIKLASAHAVMGIRQRDQHDCKAL
jgi:hypothetical protein